MERFKILKTKKMSNNWLAVQVKDNDKKMTFWLDCSLMDGYGNHDNFKTDDLYIDWDFNQYIFGIYNENDQLLKQYQENGENIDTIQDLIDENNQKLVNILKGA